MNVPMDDRWKDRLLLGSLLVVRAPYLLFLLIVFFHFSGGRGLVLIMLSA